MSTFGNTNTESGNDGGANTIWGGKFTCSGAGTPTAISIGITAGSGLGKVKYAVYRASDFQLSCYTGEWTVTGGYDAFKELAVATVVHNLTATDYYICVFMEKADWFKTAAAGGSGCKNQALAYGAFPDPATLAVYDNGYKLSAFVTYTPAAGGWTGTVNGTANPTSFNGSVLSGISKINGT